MNKKRALIRAHDNSEAAKAETNPTAHKKLTSRAGQHSCTICPPWGGTDNKIQRTPKRGTKKPRHKDHR